ncbi:MAG: GNAT family N-acetyltransferase [Micromonosporaceae bacterium]|nr:GNAT family N-acetyltransferase [Micromonosporaceae bacterium]
MEIRPRVPEDDRAVEALLTEAFTEEDCDRLISLLRASPGYVPGLDLVAVDRGHGEGDGSGRGDGDEVIGQVILTRVPLRCPDGTKRQVLCLGPIAVRPDRQGQGIGRALIERALHLADQQGEPFVLLEGDPKLYGRFGFTAAADRGLLSPSPTIPDRAFQVRPLSADDLSLRGQVDYPVSFWAACGAGIPEPVEADGPFHIPWLYQLARYCGWVEALAVDADLRTPVPACPGWDVGDVLVHLGVVHRRALGWIRDGHRPADGLAGPEDGDQRAWFATGWRELYAALAADPPSTPAATWSPWDDTNGFWRRRMVHEIVIHAHDVLSALDADPAWGVPRDIALDGIDEALRLFLATRLGGHAVGARALVCIEAGGRAWSVATHQGRIEVNSLWRPLEPQARISGGPAEVYAWLWGRGSAVTIAGDRSAIDDLRRNLAAAL